MMNGSAAESPNYLESQAVLSAIVAALSHEHSIRVPAEALIRSWESDAAPGFLFSLLEIVKLQSIEPVSVAMLMKIMRKKADCNWTCA
jgi:hypothetical protein